VTWRVQYSRAFLKELAQLPDPVRKRVERIAYGDDIKRDPLLAGRVEKMKGHSSYYKIRVGDYRVGLRLTTESQTIEFQRVLHRRDIYRKFP